MGGVANAIKKANRKGIIKKVEPPKPKPAPKKVDEAKEAKELKLANKRKGRRSTILTSSSGLNDEYEIKKNNLLG